MRFYGYKNAILLTGIVLVASCSKHHPAPVQDAARKAAFKSTKPVTKQRVYKPESAIVKKGDTLYSIGFSHSLDYKYLAQINDIKAPYSIYPGQKIRLQAKKLKVNNTIVSQSKTNTVSTHAVKSQQTKFKPITVKKILPTQPKPKPKPKTTISKKVAVAKPISKKTSPPKVVVKKAKTTVSQPVAQLNAKWLWPLKGRVISTFLISDVSRKGIDIVAKLNSPVLASQNGVVVYSGDGLRGYGELIIIKHSNNLLSAYAHNSSRLVKEGAAVKQGQVIAKSGKGTDGQGLLHFEIRKNGQPVNPLKYLPK